MFKVVYEIKEIVDGEVKVKEINGCYGSIHDVYYWLSDYQEEFGWKNVRISYLHLENE